MLLRNEATSLIEPHPMSDADFNSRVNPLSREIKRNGMRVL